MREIAVHVEGQVGVEERVEREAADVGDEQRIAVGVGARDIEHRGVAASTAFVLDDDRLAESLLHFGRDAARDDGARAAGRKRHDEANRFRGVCLRQRFPTNKNHENQNRFF
jgi:hypothetical protein